MQISFLLTKYVHFISIFGMIACLTSELILVKSTMTRSALKSVGRIDGLYGLAAMLAVGAGLTLWFGVGKGFDFYNHGIMHLKVTLVVVVGVISIIPTVFFIRNGKGNPQETVTVPSKIRKLIIAQLCIIACIPLMGTMIAYGIKL
ncbi:MAG: DUF2214 family protein [Cyclobacteriaceae bacterium]